MAASTGVGLSVFGAVTSASAQSKAGKASQSLANYNASVAELQSDDAILRGRQAEDQQRIKTRMAIGDQRAAFAASGVLVDAGSALDVQVDTAKFGEMDALTIRANAAREAWGYKVQAANSIAQGQIARDTGTNQALGTIAAAAGKAASVRFGFDTKK